MRALGRKSWNGTSALDDRRIQRAAARCGRDEVMGGTARGGSLPVWLLIVLVVVVCSGLAAIPWIALSQLKQQLARKQQVIASLTTQNNDLQQQVAASEKERKELDARLSTLRAQVSAATEELGRLRDVETRSGELKEEKNRLELQVDQLTQERRASEERINRLEEDNAALERMASRLRNRLTLLDRDYQDLATKLSQLEGRRVPSTPAPTTSPTSVLEAPTTLLTPSQTETAGGQQGAEPNPKAPPTLRPSDQEEWPRTTHPMGTSSGEHPSTSPLSVDALTPQAIELPPIVVRKSQLATSFPLRARLVEVNEAHRFVVIDQGANDGVRIGMTFDLRRGGVEVGQAVAVRVRPRIAACDLIASHTTESPQIGDLAIQRGP